MLLGITGQMAVLGHSVSESGAASVAGAGLPRAGDGAAAAVAAGGVAAVAAFSAVLQRGGAAEAAGGAAATATNATVAAAAVPPGLAFPAGDGAAHGLKLKHP